jgi:hypothetical protein
MNNFVREQEYNGSILISHARWFAVARKIRVALIFSGTERSSESELLSWIQACLSLVICSFFIDCIIASIAGDRCSDPD